ncbi:hypothetical protein LJR066_000155 [Acidovorax sp. LjRoot66]|uniref:TfpX/TfpZ family type IV pilin accessory protein n=1 Tax=Acidovorax sp. LjRoot66 TaxID=3342334 RepID=UPI003ED14846
MALDLDRWRFAARVAGWHLVMSVLIVGSAAALIFFGWYPGPFRQIFDLQIVVGILVIVDLVCGPALNFLLSNPRKTRIALRIDWVTIAIIQMSALLYGVYSVSEGRPVMVVFEIDRFVVVTAAEINSQDLDAAPFEFQKLPSIGFKLAGTRLPKDNNEFIISIEQSLQGVEPSARPNWWIAYQDALPKISQAAKPLEELLQRKPTTKHALEIAVIKTGKELGELRYLPLTSRKSKEWIVLLDRTAYPVGYAPVDGF